MEKINIAELLRDCPTGMELDCTTWENVTFEKVSNDLIYIKRNNKTHSFDNIVVLNKYGRCTNHEDEKCRIFPKGKTTWEGFQRPFKDGDIVFYYDTIAIFKEWGDETLFRTYVTKYLCCDFIDTNVPLFGKSVRKEIRFANEEEKQSLFDAIKVNGYHWNAETKTLEELPKFKINNIIRHKERKGNTRIVDIKDGNYIFENGDIMPIYMQDNYEFIANKFDINTLVPFESRVLVRDTDHYEWEGAVFGRYDGNSFFTIGGVDWKYCIPYKGNEHLFGTTNDCDSYYKTWQK